MNKRLLLYAMIVPGALAVSPMVSAQAKESVSLKEYQQANDLTQQQWTLV